MKRRTILIAWAVLTASAAGQAPSPKPLSEPELVAELKGLAKPVARSPQALEKDYARAVRHLLSRVADRRLSSRRRQAALGDLERVCLRSGRPQAEAERAAACKALLACLETPAHAAQRGAIVRILQHVGQAEAAGPLGKLLGSTDKTVREHARCALENNPSPEALTQLREALYRAAETQWKVALVNSLGSRRDAEAIEWLAKALKDSQEPVAIAAAAALGKIGGPKAIAALNNVRLLALPALRAEIANALFACADHAAAAGDKDTATNIYRKAYENATEPTQNRIAALRSMVAIEPDKALPVLLVLLKGSDEAIAPVALELARDVPGRAATKAFAALLAPAATAGRKIALIEMLGARGDPAAREAVLDALRDRKWPKDMRDTIRLAVIKALGGVGNDEDVLMLAGLAAQTIKGKEAEQKWARFSLRQLRGEEVNETLRQAVGEGNAAVRCEVIRALGARGEIEAVDQLLSLAGESDATVRRATLEALGQLAGPTHLAPLVKWMIGAKESYEVLTAERAVINVCGRCRDKATAGKILGEAVAGASPRTRRSLMRICGRLGGPDVLPTLAAGAQDDDDAVRESAVSALAHTRDVRAEQTLLQLARSAPKPEHRTEALKGYIRAMRYREQAPEKKIWLYLQVLDLAQRPEEKKLAIDGLGDIKTPASMTFAMQHLDTPVVKENAAYTVCRIARHLYTTHAQKVRSAMLRVLAVTEKEDTAKEARRILGLVQPATKPAAKP